jgi:ankyrin repeat protein
MTITFAQVFDAIAENDVETVRNYVLSNPDVVNAKTFFAGGTLLHYAAAASNPEMIQMLVSLGFDVDKASETYGHMPLHTACTKGNFDNAEALLKLGAKFDLSESFRNPLFGAIIGSSPVIIELLLKSGIDSKVTYKLEDGSVVDALGFARKRGATECEKLLGEISA